MCPEILLCYKILKVFLVSLWFFYIDFNQHSHIMQLACISSVFSDICHRPPWCQIKVLWMHGEWLPVIRTEVLSLQHHLSILIEVLEGVILRHYIYFIWYCILGKACIIGVIGKKSNCSIYHTSKYCQCVSGFYLHTQKHGSKDISGESENSFILYSSIQVYNVEFSR